MRLAGDLKMIADKLRLVCSVCHVRHHLMLWNLFRNIRVQGSATCYCGWKFERR